MSKMPVSLTEETLLSAPLATIQRLFEENHNGDNHGDWGVQKFFESVVGSDWSKVRTHVSASPHFL